MLGLVEKSMAGLLRYMLFMLSMLLLNYCVVRLVETEMFFLSFINSLGTLLSSTFSNMKTNVVIRLDNTDMS